MKNLKLENSVKTITLANGEFLHFWYANNKGRGSNNCTIIRSKTERAKLSNSQCHVLAKTQTSSWAGNVNFSKKVQNLLGV